MKQIEQIHMEEMCKQALNALVLIEFGACSWKFTTNEVSNG